MSRTPGITSSARGRPFHQGHAELRGVQPLLAGRLIGCRVVECASLGRGVEFDNDDAFGIGRSLQDLRPHAAHNVAPACRVDCGRR
jgi:hypothetical protein